MTKSLLAGKELNVLDANQTKSSFILLSINAEYPSVPLEHIASFGFAGTYIFHKKTGLLGLQPGTIKTSQLSYLD